MLSLSIRVHQDKLHNELAENTGMNIYKTSIDMPLDTVMKNHYKALIFGSD